MAEALKKFGKYFLLDLIAQGGMAEIYRARMETPDGGARLVAIKRILTTYSQNPEFVGMFKGEIKTTSGFTHPNIVQIYDFGEEQQQLYLAMELVDGKNLRQFLSRTADQKAAFPLEATVFIIEQAAGALAYAHNYKDKFTGKALNLVHRDVSPQNILISYDGAVKLIDFGIAKAVTNLENTRAGVIKGKPSYLAPEQVSGEVLDGRSDIFALGIVLWEVLAGKKLFQSDNDYGVLRLIENSQNHVKPPSQINPAVPKELDAIVMKALQKDRNQRFQTAEELQRALHKALYQIAPDFNPADLSYFARDLFKNEIVEDRKRLVALNEKVEKVIAAAKEKEKQSDTPGSPGIKLQDQTPSPGTPSFRKENVVELTSKSNIAVDWKGSGLKEAAPRPEAATEFVPAVSGIKATPAPASRRGPAQGRGKAAATGGGGLRRAIMLLIVLGGAGFWVYDSYFNGTLDRTLAGAKAAGVLSVQSNVKTATVTVNGRIVANALPVTLKKLPTDQPLTIIIASNGYKKFSQQITLKKGEPKSLDATLEREEGATVASDASAPATPPRQVTLKLNILPPAPGLVTQIRLSGGTIDPLTGIGSAPANTPLELVVERDRFRTFRKTFTIDGAQVPEGQEWVMTVPLEVAKFGFLSVKTTPSADAILVIDGVEEKLPTPISRKRIPVGTYQLRLVNSLLGMEKTITVNIAEDRFTNVEERLVTERSPSGR